MNRNLLKNFARDKLPLLLFYCANAAAIILFYNLIHPGRTEILYPASITVFLLVILMTLEWRRYYTFNQNLHRAAADVYYHLEPLTREQKEIDRVIKSINDNYAASINSGALVHEEKIHILAQSMHQLKTSISVMELVIQKHAADKHLPWEAVEKIRQENNSLDHKVEQVLSYIRLDTFEKDYHIEPVDLVTLLKKLINERRTHFIYNRVFPELVTEHEALYVLTDSKWSSNMLEQIISNAVKYSSHPNESKRIVFTLSRDDQFTRLAVRDEGVGIPAYDLKKVFEPFFTGENGRKFRNSTGIGLHMCRIIADRLDHKIEITSEPSKGTEVTIQYLSKL